MRQTTKLTLAWANLSSFVLSATVDTSASLSSSLRLSCLRDVSWVIQLHEVAHAWSAAFSLATASSRSACVDLATRLATFSFSYCARITSVFCFSSARRR